MTCLALVLAVVAYLYASAIWFVLLRGSDPHGEGSWVKDLGYALAWPAWFLKLL